ncbi:response regulator transcription factor [Metasolibacillus sp.]|uniref:response regulator transcription factor n=1 Tax=Metasolibacillus sp. TaxID=2703680 RepID=UPI0025E89CFC|nr:response regulator transcription factor [Metasolibacillus sp.]MCT6924647.1 response regulator transcription factor [Metasolibacillus sp.]MCT6940849.1 response regulator transcription factor [Metasolibacillus sp.]
MTTVLIVDDERDMRNLLEVVLRKENIQTITASNGYEAYEQLNKRTIDLILLDIMMPEIDGFTVCKTIRQTSNIPIIFLTAKDANEDKVNGLTIGGDDYIVKPFTANEVIARIFAVLRRTEAVDMQLTQRLLVHGIIKIDEISRKVFVQDKPVPLTLKEYEILHLFMQNPNIVYSREKLLDCIWDMDYAGGTRTVDTHIKTLRLKLGTQLKDASEYIQTVWGIGYRFGEPL